MSLNKDLQVEQFISRLKRRQIVGSTQSALETAHLLRSLLSQLRWQTADSLLSLLRDVGNSLVKAQKTELAVGNTVRRVLRLIRDEYKSMPDESIAGNLNEEDIDKKQQRKISGGSSKRRESDEISVQFSSHKPLFSENIRQTNSGFAHPSSSLLSLTDSSMYNLLANSHPNFKDSINYHALKYSLKPLIIQSINELIDELENSRVNISNQALDHIQNGECIMTIGKSKTVEEFLVYAARKRSFNVYVSETAPLYDGHILANNLAKAGINTTIIPESAIDVIMGQVNKVIVGCHAVLANGGLLAVTGTQLLATCARHHSVPVVVVSGIYKLSPCFPSDKDLFYHTISPSSILPFDNDMIDYVDILSPYYDYVDPNFVSLFITNMGGHVPSYLYRLLGEYYDPNDDDLGTF